MHQFLPNGSNYILKLSIQRVYQDIKFDAQIFLLRRQKLDSLSLSLLYFDAFSLLYLRITKSQTTHFTRQIIISFIIQDPMPRHFIITLTIIKIYHIIPIMKSQRGRSEEQRLILKRNKHYYDIKSLQLRDKHTLIRHRTPESSVKSVSCQLKKHKPRYSIISTTSNLNNNHRYASETKHIKGIFMDLALPRKSFIQLQKGPITQRNFNNFYLQKPNLNRTASLGKCLGRERYSKTNQQKQLGDDLTKTYEQFYYSSSMGCKFNYNKNRGRDNLFLEKRNSEDPVTNLDDQKVYKAFLKTRTNDHSFVAFSKTLGKQTPSSFDRRLLKTSQNYWRTSSAKHRFPTPSQMAGLRTKKQALVGIKRMNCASKQEVCAHIYYRSKE